MSLSHNISASSSVMLGFALALRFSFTPEELGRIEMAAKADRRTERLRKQSGLLPGKTLRTLDLNQFDAATRMQMP
jgi:hypothetical protein